jgi:hypothetical protein
MSAFQHAQASPSLVSTPRPFIRRLSASQQGLENAGVLTG